MPPGFTVCSFFFFFFVMAGIVRAGFNYTTTPSKFLIVLEGEVADLLFNATESTKQLTIEVSSRDPQIFTTEQDSFRILHLNGTQSISIPIHGLRLGIAYLDFVTRDSTGLIDPDLDIPPFVVKVRRSGGVVGTVFTYVLLMWLMMSYVTMGVKLEWEIIKEKLKRPFGVVIGALCQFILMPGVAASLVRVFNLDPPAAVALIIVGSCPGGWLSNIFTLLLECDLVLSLTMTFFSTVIALGLMPLNLFIYATPYTSNNSNIRIPFVQIFIQLITLVVPLFIGTLIAHRYPRAAKWFRRLLKPLAAFLVIIGLTVGLWANYFAFQSPAEGYLSAILLPSVAAIIGLLIAKMTCLSNRSAITIAIETGSQNSLLAISVIGLSFPQPEADLMIRVPVLFVTFTFFILFSITGVYVIMNRFPGRFELPSEDINECFSSSTPHTGSANSDINLSAMNNGLSSEQLKGKPRSRNQNQKPSQRTCTQATQVDYQEINDRSRRCTDAFHINRGFSVESYEGHSSPRYAPSPVVSVSRPTISINDPDIRNTAARQVYL